MLQSRMDKTDCNIQEKFSTMKSQHMNVFFLVNLFLPLMMMWTQFQYLLYAWLMFNACPFTTRVLQGKMFTRKQTDGFSNLSSNRERSQKRIMWNTESLIGSDRAKLEKMKSRKWNEQGKISAVNENIAFHWFWHCFTKKRCRFWSTNPLVEANPHNEWFVFSSIVLCSCKKQGNEAIYQCTKVFYCIYSLPDIQITYPICIWTMLSIKLPM